MSKLLIEPVSTTAIPPSKSTTFAAGFDVHADLSERSVFLLNRKNHKSEIRTGVDAGVCIPSGCRLIIPTGFKMQCEEGYCIKFYPRSGTGIKKGIRLANGTGIIDHDYQDECLVCLHNTTDEVIFINHGDRICQLMVERLDNTTIEVVTSLPAVDSNRTGGLGSTGK